MQSYKCTLYTFEKYENLSKNTGIKRTLLYSFESCEESRYQRIKIKMLFLNSSRFKCRYDGRNVTN